MKRLLIIILFFLNVNLFSQNGFEITIVPYDYQYVLSGKLDNSDIELHYCLVNDLISGYYYYKSDFRSINILGFIKNDSITIFEFDSEINKTAKFVGVVSTDSIFFGNWTDLRDDRIIPFKLKGEFSPFKNYEGYLSIKKENKIRLHNLDSLAGKLYYIKPLYWNEKNDNYYFVFRADGFEGNWGNPNGPCGGGIAQTLICMKIDNKYNFVINSSFVIGSCFDRIYTEIEDGEWIEKRYLKFSGHTDFKDFVVTYDINIPEKGLKIEYFEKK